MEAIAAKEFFEKLNSGDLKSATKLFGIVKKSDRESELLFSFKGDRSNWIKIPESMIEHVHVLKQFTCEGESMTKVKIRLKEPSAPEAKVLYDLLGGLAHKMYMLWEMKKMMMEKGMDEHPKGEGSGNWSHYKSGMGCGCHHHHY